MLEMFSKYLWKRQQKIKVQRNGTPFPGAIHMPHDQKRVSQGESANEEKQKIPINVNWQSRGVSNI